MKYITTIIISSFLITSSVFASDAHKQWEKPFSEESHVDVRNWIINLLTRYYDYSLEGNKEEMARMLEEIRILMHLEYGSNHRN